MSNFDWGITERKLVIFLPNYNMSKMAEFSITKIKTVVPQKDWIIIIGNDNENYDFSHLESQNVRFFTLNRKDKNPRNSLFIRNYLIKRCRSELLFQKDAEVCLKGDFIASCMNGHWRAGYIKVLNQAQTKLFLDSKDPKCNIIKIDPTIPTDLQKFKQLLLRKNGSRSYNTFWHYACCMHTKHLQDMHGYDEDFKLYGWGDPDMFCRLIASKYYLIPDYNCCAIHPDHNRGKTHEDAIKMKEIFKLKDPTIIIRNNEWGAG